MLLDDRAMKVGDRAGLAVLRDASAYIAVERDTEAMRVAMTSGATLGRGWHPQMPGRVEESVNLRPGRVWLRATVDIRPGTGRTARLSFSTDGRQFRTLGQPFVLNAEWPFFMGYRFALFNYATQELGGHVLVSNFQITCEKPM
jgi:hypothetical protein